jgi:hypothetical protein
VPLKMIPFVTVPAVCVIFKALVRVPPVV